MATRARRKHEHRDHQPESPQSGVFEVAGDRRVARRGSTGRVDEGSRTLRRGSTWSDRDDS